MASWENEISRVREYILEAIEARGLTTSNIGVIASEVKVVPIEEVNEEKLGMDACFKKAFLLETV
jgi:hypothetical protein